MQKLSLKSTLSAELATNISILLQSGLVVHGAAIDEREVAAMAFALTKMPRAQQQEQLASFERTVFFRGDETSNARLVEWEDGNWSLFVGDKCFDLELGSNADSLLYAAEGEWLVNKLNPTHIASADVWNAAEEL